jgi:hypothetical protein
VLQELNPNPVNGNAAAELVELGWFAIPLLIECLDDQRPTRCLGYWRDFEPGSFYLLRIGDCCQQILRAITGQRLYIRRDTNGYPVKDGKSAELKALYSKWWAENASLSPEEFYGRRLGSEDPGVRATAARTLLKADAKKHLGAVLAAIDSKGPGPGGCILEIAVSHLGKSHEPVMDAFLKSKDDFVSLIAAQFLLDKCGSERGAAEILARLKAWPKQDMSMSNFPSYAFTFLVRSRDSKIAEGVAGLFRHESRVIRLEAVGNARYFASPVVAQALLALLGDASDTGMLINDVEIRVCDHACGSLAELLAYPVRFEWQKPADVRDKYIAELIVWWKENRDKADWLDLAKKAAERLEKD